MVLSLKNFKESGSGYQERVRGLLYSTDQTFDVRDRSLFIYPKLTSVLVLEDGLSQSQELEDPSYW